LRRVEALPKAKSAIYLRKARAFESLMRSALDAKNAEGTGLSAVHCTISGLDALTVGLLGKRSSAADHFDAISLVEETGRPGGASAVR
jgi:hypothetical protein